MALVVLCLMMPMHAFANEVYEIWPVDYTYMHCVEVDATKRTIEGYEEFAYYEADANDPITITPKDGYKLTQVEVMMADAEPVPCTLAADGSKCTFTMPESNVDLFVVVESVNGGSVEHIVTVRTAGGGDPVADKSMATAGETVTITLNPLEGRVFDYIKLEYNVGYDEAYDYCYDTSFTMPDSDVIVMVYYKLGDEGTETPSFKVTFDPNDGSTTTTDSTVNGNNKLNVLPKPEREGYTLVGWFTQPEGGEQVTTDTVFTQDTTIYARWMKAEHTTKPEENAFESNIEMDDLDILDMLVTPDDMAEAGDLGVKVYLTVDRKQETTVPETEKTAIDAKAGENQIAAYLDINLYKQIGDDEPERISNPNGAVPIVMTLDQGIIPDNAAEDSVFIIYYHGNEAKTIEEVAYNSNTGKLQFSAKEFSYYALAYEPGSGEQSQPPQPPVPNNPQIPTPAPKTGDDSNFALWLCLMTVSLIGIKVLTHKTKKQY